MNRQWPIAGKGDSQLRTRVASPILLVAICVTLMSVWRAWTLDPLPPVVAPAEERSVPRVTPVEPTPGEFLVAAIRRDPFHPERRSTLDRFQIEPPTDSPSNDGAVLNPASLRLLGTVVLANGKSMAMVEGLTDRPRMMRVGERFEGLRLTTVERGKAVFVTARGEKRSLQVDPEQG